MKEVRSFDPLYKENLKKYLEKIKEEKTMQLFEKMLSNDYKERPTIA